MPTLNSHHIATTDCRAEEDQGLRESPTLMARPLRPARRTPGVVRLECLRAVLNVAATQATDVHIGAGAMHLRFSEHYR